MDWVKVKVKHAEYDFEGAPDNVFRAWIKLMTFVAFIERKPNYAQLEARLGRDNYLALEQHLLSNGYKTGDVIDKVLEDVFQSNNLRRKGKERQARHRELHQSNVLRNADITAGDKIREDKIREAPKTVPKGTTDEKPKSIPRKHFKDLGTPDPKEQEEVAKMIARDKVRL